MASLKINLQGFPTFNAACLVRVLRNKDVVTPNEQLDTRIVKLSQHIEELSFHKRGGCNASGGILLSNVQHTRQRLINATSRRCPTP